MKPGVRFDTIVAPATPAGASALAIVRIDGPEALGIALALCGRDRFEPRHATYSELRDGEDVLDDAVVTAFIAPASYTGNDLVEISIHGSTYLACRVVEAARSRGARIAEPGEFTERAVLNGKLDLVQAESVVDLIGSRTSLQAKLSLRNLSGDLSRLGESMRARLVDLISRVEAALDFGDEEYQFVSQAEMEEAVLALISEARRMAETYARGHSIQAGLTAVILGRPNAGKSTLLNFLCGTDRAIVTPLPGTTRDLLRETVDLGGIPVTFIDTAGLRPTDDTIEEIGIGRARDAAKGADLVLYLVDASAGETKEDAAEIAALPDPLVVYTKVDLTPDPAEIAIEALDVRPGVSVEQRIGLEEFLAMLDERVRIRFDLGESGPTVVSERQRAAFAECAEALEAALGSIRAGAHEEIVAVDLRRAANAMAALTGAISNEEIYGEIFSRFCIGK